MKRLAVAGLLWAIGTLSAQAQFRVTPYLQNPSGTGITVVWLSADDRPGRLVCVEEGGTVPVFAADSAPRLAPALAYAPSEARWFKDGKTPALPYQHALRIAGLRPGARYTCEVTQGEAKVTARFRAAPPEDAPIRIIAYGDAEAEPESTGSRVAWTDPNAPSSARTYLVDQTQGYAAHLEVIRSRAPDLVIVAGDLVESGGEQRDWDEFWRHNAPAGGPAGVGATSVILPALGNHEYYGGPADGGYTQPASERAVAKFLTYFSSPPNGSPVKEHEGRYYSVRYGAAAIIVLDLNNGAPAGSADDTNHMLEPPFPLGFHPGSAQFAWLERELAAAQAANGFTIVVAHQSPWSSGVHGAPGERLSGAPMRALFPLFFKHGVDLVVTGHDEMFERSEVAGEELLPTGSRRPHVIQVYDVGVGGDGLRGPADGGANPHRAFLAHRDAPEVWDNGVLVSGGKHYGHLEIDVARDGKRWRADLTPVYVLPIVQAGTNEPVRFERRIYPDVKVLFSDK